MSHLSLSLTRTSNHERKRKKSFGKRRFSPTSLVNVSVRRSQRVQHLTLLHAGVKRLPEHKGVQPRPQLLGQGHDDVQVSLHVQVQVRLQVAQGLKRLLPLLPARRWRG